MFDRSFRRSARAAWPGVLQAKDPETASRRLSAYQLAQRLEALTVDEAVSEASADDASMSASAGNGTHVNEQATKFAVEGLKPGRPDEGSNATDQSACHSRVGLSCPPETASATVQ
jgi:hypothetical protein